VEGEKPKRVSLPKHLKPQDLTLETALAWLALPRDIGIHPESGDKISAGIGRFGPYLKHGKAFKSLTPDDDVLTIGINRAVSLLAEPSKGGRGAPTVLRTVGPHPADAASIELYKGRFGPYLSHGGVNATLPRGTEPEAVTVEDAVKLLDAQKAKGKPARGKAQARKAKTAAAPAKKAPVRKAAASDTTTKKTTEKKPAAKKKAASAEADAPVKKTAAVRRAPAS
jgi:DNA topoisomerase-1